jgi:2',3'-cyclic-nucleotide 2'-phosphodiesterase (5'-nucleotidase family)
MEALVRPFREAMAGRIEEVIGEAAVELTEGRPEGNLGNFATDALLWATDSLLGAPAQLALMNNGGLRIPLARGPITVGTMFELMPFENMVAILTLTGEQVVALAGEIAGRGGEPIAGFSFRIESQGGERVARDVRIGGEPVDSAAHYRLVTNDYLANGGDDMPALTRPVARTDYPLLVRDAFIEYLKMIGAVEVGIEGRITGEVGR